jgi:hypothetical protein
MEIWLHWKDIFLISFIVNAIALVLLLQFIKVNVISLRWVHCFWYNIRCWIFGGNFTLLQSNKKMLKIVSFVISRFSFKVTPFSSIISQNRQGCSNCYGWTPLLLSRLVVMDNQSFYYMKLLKEKTLLTSSFLCYFL